MAALTSGACGAPTWPKYTFLCASGGNATVTCGNFKTHIFTANGTFTVNSLATAPANNAVDYIIVAGGGGGGSNQGGGGGAGGFRMSNSLCLPSPTTSPLASDCGVTVTAQGYSIVVGGGGAGAPAGSPQPRSTAGVDSSALGLTSAGGGAAGGGNNCGSPLRVGGNGGSGGGGGFGDDAYNPPKYGPGVAPGGSGNTPPTDPPQGKDGGSSGIGCFGYGGGGGGAGSIGGTPAPSTSAGGDGSYIADSFVGPTSGCYGTPGPAGCTRYFAGGGAGRSRPGVANTEVGGFGGGGDYTHPGSPGCNAAAAGTNTGGGGGSVYPGTGGAGGSGIVMIRYKYQ